ncbi:unnamed protein product, partial [Rotaria socialis]
LNPTLTSYEQLAQQALALVQKMNDWRHHLRLVLSFEVGCFIK